MKNVARIPAEMTLLRRSNGTNNATEIIKTPEIRVPYHRLPEELV